METTSSQAEQVGDMSAAASVDRGEIRPVSPYQAALFDYIMPFGMLWIFFAVFGLISTRQLLYYEGFSFREWQRHFQHASRRLVPVWLTVHGLALSLTFLHLALAQVIFLALKLLGGGYKKLKNCFRNISRAAVWAWIVQLPQARDEIFLSSLLLAFSWPFTMLAVVHLENLPTLSKLCLFPFLIQTLVPRVLTLNAWAKTQPRRQGRRLLVMLFCVPVIFLDEYRLTAKGVIYALAALTLVGLSNSCLAPPRALETLSPPSLPDPRPIAVDRRLGVAIPIGLLGTGVAAWLTEDMRLASTRFRDAGWLTMTDSIVLGASCILLGGSQVSYSLMSDLDDGLLWMGSESGWRVSCINGIATYLIVIVFAFVERLQTGLLQTVAFVIALIAFMGPSRHYTHRPSESSSQGLKKNGESGPLIPKLASAMWICSLSVLSHLLSYYFGTVMWRLSSDTPKTHIDHTYMPNGTFDIVVSMYQEDLDSVKRLTTDIRGIPSISRLAPQLIIYVKDEAADEATIREKTSADVVQKLENRGREGATYLHHITSRWNNLAEHTLFIQADVHNRREFFYRIRKFYRPDTGMLSLGFSGVACDCEDCSDRWGWRDDFALVLRAYQNVYNTTCSRALLSYKGQFIASGRRIRGAPLSFYQYLYDGLVDPDGWGHPKAPDAHFEDSLDAPYLGYTVERLWNILMQCSDRDVMWKCPSLMSGWRAFGTTSDCQCLDSDE